MTPIMLRAAALAVRDPNPTDPTLRYLRRAMGLPVGDQVNAPATMPEPTAIAAAVVRQASGGLQHSSAIPAAECQQKTTFAVAECQRLLSFFECRHPAGKRCGHRHTSNDKAARCAAKLGDGWQVAGPIEA